MSFKKVILGLVAIAVGIPALFIGFIAVNLFVYGPLKHIWNTHKAEASNQTTWETGFADIYTVVATIVVNNEKHTASMEVICVHKVETQTINFKESHPFVWNMNINFSQQGLAIPLYENYRIVYKTNFSCGGIANQLETKEFPFNLRHPQTVELQITAENVTSRRIYLYEEMVQTYTTQYFPIQVLSVRQERVSDVISRDIYGPADRAVARQREQDDPVANER